LGDEFECQERAALSFCRNRFRYNRYPLAIAGNTESIPIREFLSLEKREKPEEHLAYYWFNSRVEKAAYWETEEQADIDCALFNHLQIEIPSSITEEGQVYAASRDGEQLHETPFSWKRCVALTRCSLLS
jgi:hypothetical protein